MGLQTPEDVERGGEGEGGYPDEEHGDDGAHRLETRSCRVHDQLKAKEKKYYNLCQYFLNAYALLGPKGG